MRKVVTLLLFGCIANLFGQKSALPESIEENLIQQLLVFPHEKIYLHTDKPYYITGEKIFFRAFLLDAFSNQQIASSRYVYVELINPTDSIVQRLKIRPDSTDLFYGAIPLPEDLPQGVYQMRAYTQYMRNQGESSFFTKSVRISDPQVLKIQTETDFQFAADGRVNTSLRFLDAQTKEIIHPQSISLRLNQDRQFTAKPDEEGWIRIRLNIPAKATTRVLYAELTANNRVFKQYLRIPYPEGDFDVSFYPEGGHLVAGQHSTVAFKALGSNGKALDIKGEIVNSKGDIVTAFKTIHDGMGEFFIINPIPDEHYQAVCHYGNRTLSFDLPEVETNVFALKTVFRGDKLLISINKNSSATVPELYLLIHSDGLVVYNELWDASKEYVTLEKSQFSSGISHILLLTKDLQVVSDRLVFLLNDDNGFAELKTKKDVYRKREHVETEIQLKDEMQFPVAGSFSIAITNDKEVIPDTASHILSEILLRSELRGNIENPAYYFQKRNKEAEMAADLLMKTHGWARYAIPDVIRGKLSYPEISFEDSQEISGTVKSGLNSKPAKGFQVSLISLTQDFFDTAKTDNDGRYVFKGVDFPDSTKFAIQALNSKGGGKRMIELYVDEETFPEAHTVWSEPIIRETEIEPVLLDYVAKADLHYSYKNGMRMINLPEVQIKGTYQEKDWDMSRSIYYSDLDYSISEEEIERWHSMESLLSQVPGVRVDWVMVGFPIKSIKKVVSIRGYGSPLIVMDDVIQKDLDIFTDIDIGAIWKIDILKDAGAAIFGVSGNHGVIIIHTKRGKTDNKPVPSFNIKPATPLGYQLPIEFYSPKYDTQESINDSKPDLRTTIYWSPNVVTDDDGKVKLDFYTADDPATYSVIIEGVSDDGKLISYYGNASIIVE